MGIFLILAWSQASSSLLSAAGNHYSTFPIPAPLFGGHKLTCMSPKQNRPRAGILGSEFTCRAPHCVGVVPQPGPECPRLCPGSQISQQDLPEPEEEASRSGPGPQGRHLR